MKSTFTQTGDLFDSAIESIATECQLSKDDVRQLFEEQYQRLDKQSRIKSFIPILCTKNVKEIIRHSRFSKPSRANLLLK